MRTLNRLRACLFPPAVSWFLPYWSHIPRMWRTWKSFLFSDVLLRASLLSIAAGSLLIIAVKVCIPLVQLPPWWQFAIMLPVFYAYLLLMALLYVVFPARVKVRKDMLHVIAGQSHWIVKPGQIRKIRIVVFAPDRVRLSVFHAVKSKRGVRRFGVGRRVDLVRLLEMLPVKAQVWDARGRL